MLHLDKIDGKYYEVIFEGEDCPFCGQVHTHAEDDGRRSPHCVERNIGIKIAVNNNDGYIHRRSMRKTSKN